MKNLIGTLIGVIVYVSGTVSPQANIISQDTITGVQFQLDGVNLGPALTTAPYTFSWNTTMTADGSHTLSVIVTDAAGATGTDMVNVVVANKPKVELGIH